MTLVGLCAAQDVVKDTRQQTHLVTSRLQNMTELTVQARYNSSHALIFELAILHVV